MRLIMMAQLLEAILALIGLLVVGAVALDEARAWCDDIRLGHAQYRAIRQARRIGRRFVVAAARTQLVLGLAQRRMMATALQADPFRSGAGRHAEDGTR